MIENDDLKNILRTAIDISTVAEIYAADAVPGDDGFDPSDALECFAAIDGLVFQGRDYKKLIKSFNNPSRSMTSEANTAGITFSNLTREIAQFEFEHGFEGLILVIRYLSRSLSDSLDKSHIVFSGVCEKPKSGKKDSFSISAKSIIDALEVNIPRRKFTPEDYKGREKTDPEFEGFIEMPQTGSVSYSERVRRGGLLGLFGFKKTVQKTLAYSSFSDLDANRPLPEIFGTMQIVGTFLGYVDIGTALKIRVAWCEGEIEDIINARSTNLQFPLNPINYVEMYGKVGTLNGPDDPSWIAPGYWSRTAHIRGQLDNSAIDVTDDAPDIVAVIKGRKLKNPDADNDWNANPIAWTNNAASVWRYLLTGGDYFTLDENWIDDDSAAQTWRYNDEKIFNVNSSDFLFLDE